MIFKEVGQTMDLLLVKVAEEHHIDAGPCVSKKPSYSWAYQTDYC